MSTALQEIFLSLDASVACFGASQSDLFFILFNKNVHYDYHYFLNVIFIFIIFFIIINIFIIINFIIIFTIIINIIIFIIISINIVQRDAFNTSEA